MTSRAWIALVLTAVMIPILPKQVLAQAEWEPLARIPTSESPVRWTTIQATPNQNLHAFWAVPAEATETDPYASVYQVILYSTSIDGQFWTPPTDIIYDQGAMNSVKALFAQGSHHLFWSSDCVWHASAPPGESAANAQSWLATKACIAPGAIIEGIAVASNDAGQLFLVYSSGESLYLQKSLDGGRAWSVAATIATAIESGGAAFMAYPAIAVSGDAIYVVWSASASAAQGFAGLGVFFARSLDGGESWHGPQPISDKDSAQPTVAVDASNTIHVIWNTRVGVSKRIYRASGDGGNTWSDEVAIFDGSSDGTSAGMQGAPALLVTSAGELQALVGTNAGPRLRTQRDGVWGQLEIPGEPGDGETWTTGLTLIGAQRFCAYWNVGSGPNAGPLVRCRGAQPDAPTDRDVPLLQPVQNPTPQALQQEVAPTQSAQPGTATPIIHNDPEYSQVPLSDAQRVPQPWTNSTNVGLFAAGAFSLLVVVMVTLFQLRRR